METLDKQPWKISNLTSPCLEDHRWLGDSTHEGKVSFIRLGYLNENRGNWGY